MHKESEKQVKSTHATPSTICVTFCLLSFLILKPYKNIYFPSLQLDLFTT